jgi:NTP pyrophosphatase (non-canonical NTP hydrolase)
MAKDVYDDMVDLHHKTIDLALGRGKEHLRTSEGRQEYCAMGLAGEAGEVANLYKKTMRGQPIPDLEFEEEIADTYSYLQMLAYERGIDLDDVLRKKLVKYRAKLEGGLV